MLTFRGIPPGFVAHPDREPNGLLRIYRTALLRHWNRRERGLAAWLGRAGLGVAWSPAELSFLSPEVRVAGLSMAERKGLHRVLNPASFPLAANPLKNKDLFARHARAHGLPAPAGFDPKAGPLAAWLESRDAILVKNNYSSKGKGIEAFARRAGGWSGNAGPLSTADLLVCLRGALARGAVVQERLFPHPALADISPGALPTVRVMTCRDEQGEPEECGLVLRLSAGGPRPVDNFNAGNLATRVESDGLCGPTMHRRGDRAVAVATHPSTGASFAGRPIPDLDAAVQLASRAHRTLGYGFLTVGWDVGLTPDGPVLIEGNWNPGTVIPQLIGGTGVDDTRLGELYRYHLLRVPAARWKAARPVHWDRRPASADGADRQPATVVDDDPEVQRAARDGDRHVLERRP